MEVIGYFVIYVSCLLLKKVNLVNNQTITEFISSTAGGAVEEMMESVVQWIFPNGSFFFTKRMKESKKITEEVWDYILKLTPEERADLVNFINGLDFSKMKIPEFKNITELVEGDLAKFFEGVERSGDYVGRQKIKAFTNTIKTALSKAYERIDKEQNEKLYDTTIDCIVKDLFDVDWNSIPKSVREMFKLFNDKIYELKYLRLSSEDQDLVKIVQQIYNEGNAKLIETLKPSFDYIDQISSMAGTKFKKVKIDSMAKTNPYCYFRLECPNCKASGRNVYKDSENNIHCRKCGETFSIISGIQDNEIKQMLDDAYREISVVKQNISDAKESTEKELKNLAAKIVEVEYFETFKKSIKESISDHSIEISRTVEKFVHESEENINKKIESVVNILRENNSYVSMTASELSKNITTAIASLNEENKKHQADMYNLMQQNSQDVNEIKTMVTMMLPMMMEQMNNIEKLQKTFKYMNTVMYAPSTENHISERVCPHCGHMAEFERKQNEKYYVCKYCSCYIDMDDMNNPSLPINAIEVEIKEFGNSYFAFNNKGSNVGKNPKVARIHISPSMANCLKDNKLCSLTNYQLLSQTETLIIFGNVNLNARALGRIIGCNQNIRVIVLGNGSGLAIEGDASAWQPNLGDGSSWKYEKDLHKLSRKNI